MPIAGLPLPAGGLYAITAAVENKQQLLLRAETCLASGAAVLQYRDKSRSFVERLELSCELREICHRYRKPLVINDDLALAVESAADGLHIGKDELYALSLAKKAHAALWVGVSCYDSLQRAREAVTAGADYVAFGSVFESSTKPFATLASLDLLRAARAELAVPIVAIGGITPENGHHVVAAGAHFLAVISGIFGRSDTATATARYAHLFT
jgi:thiamine-phosphate pyrophosphorylase